MKIPNSIRSRLRLTYISLAIGPLLLVGVALTWLSYTIQQQQALILQRELAQQVANQVKAFIETLENDLRVMSEVSNIKELSPEQQEAILDKLLASHHAFDELVLLDEVGKERARSAYLEIVTPADLGQRSDALEFTTPKSTGETHYSPIRIEETGEPFMTIAVPLLDAHTGAVDSVIVADINFKEIWYLIASIEAHEGENIYIVDAASRVVAHRNPSEVLKGTTFTVPDRDGIQNGLTGTSVFLATKTLDFGNQQLIIVAEKPIVKVLALSLNTIIIVSLLILGTLAIGSGLALLAAKHILDPIQALARAAQAIRSGDLSQHVKRTGLVELDDLATTFNLMTMQLRQTMESLEQRVADRTQALKTSAEVSRHLSTILDQKQLVAEVVEVLRSAFNYYHANIFLLDEPSQTLVLVAGSGTVGQQMLAQGYTIPKGKGVVGQAAASKQALLVADVRQTANWTTNPLLPDTKTEVAIPIIRAHDVLGVLDVQHHVAGGLQQADVDLIRSLANQMAIALHNAQTFEQLVGEKLAEARRKEEAERQLTAYRQSPAGRAEVMAQALWAKPELALIELHGLAQAASQSLDSASLLSHLPKVLGNTTLAPGSNDRDSKGQMLESLAEGFNYLYTSQNTPELLLVGLRLLITQLEQPATATWVGAAAALALYQFCQLAVEVNAIGQITQLEVEKLSGRQEHSLNQLPFASLATTLSELQPAVNALNAYERVTETQDKLAYLVSTVEHLHRVERLARTTLGGTDRPIVQRVTEKWLAIVTGALSELQTQAKIVCHLLTRHTWQDDVIAVTLSLRNEGQGAALNLRISLAPGPEYTLLDEGAMVERLAPGEETQVALRVRPRLARNVSQFRARFVIAYADPWRPDQVENFADVVQLLTDGGEFQYIANPYVVGTPLEAGSALFYGREELLTAIQADLTPAQGNNLVLIGQRRMGKTSLLKQLRLRLGPEFLPVYLDGQILGLDPGIANFFLNLATEITFAVEDHGMALATPEFDDFTPSPANTFEHQFLPRVWQTIDRRHLLILFDEFEELESVVRRGHLDVSIFSYLRHLMQHTPNLSFIFCGTHRLEELAADYWSVLFNISLYQHVGYLAKAEALRLIEEPVASYGMRYDDLALDKMWRITAGHPYFLQLLCHSLVNRHNKNERNYVTIVDVNAALEEILAAGEAHFIYLWLESSPAERLTLAALSRMAPLTGQATPVQVVDYLAEHGVHWERPAMSEAMHRLALRDILRVGNQTESAADVMYQWRLGLLGLWVEKYKSLGRAVDEVQL